MSATIDAFSALLSNLPPLPPSRFLVVTREIKRRKRKEEDSCQLAAKNTKGEGERKGFHYIAGGGRVAAE